MIVVFVAALYFGSKLLPMSNNYFIDIPYRSLIVTIIYALGVYYLKFSDEVNGVIDRIWGNIFKK